MDLDVVHANGRGRDVVTGERESESEIVGSLTKLNDSLSFETVELLSAFCVRVMWCCVGASASAQTCA